MAAGGGVFPGSTIDQPVALLIAATASGLAMHVLGALGEGAQEGLELLAAGFSLMNFGVAMMTLP